ncbi:LCP family protein [Bacillus sp. PS06]|uniref:LCP family protein n=1 Tax=Bacillus sp. PS06 TaxID=2764176 RepID=UPI00177F4614|nr:LCP family protein [Bacillus sp. PS06]MBD8071384.1 LCP family protein [Bacillus sp. PS06]
MAINQRQVIKKKRRRRRILLWILVPLLVLGTGIGLYATYLVNKAASAAQTSQEGLERGDKSEKREQAVNPKHDNISILFMGVDDSQKREMGNATRTDALILATLNEKEKSIKMVSIPRDSLVYIPSMDKEDKINHAYYRGTESTIQTVEELFDIPVDYFVKMNFEAFIDVVEALDGIYVDVPITFSEMDSRDRKNAIQLEEGFQLLNGEEALALARTRKLDSDIERGKRQQIIMKSIISRAASLQSLSKYGNVIDALGDNITTNFKFGELIALHDYAISGERLGIESFHLKGSDLWTPTYYYQLDQESVQEISATLQEHLRLGVYGERNDSSLVNNTDVAADTETETP